MGNSMNHIYKFMCLAGYCVGLSSCVPKEEVKPNILFILSDDHAVNSIGCYGKRLSEYANTPNIDKLASEGMLFSQAFCTNSISSPSRATILTGKYSHKNGVYCLDQDFRKQPTFVTALHEAGYQTAVYGKWHLKSNPEDVDDYKVLERQGRYWNPQYVEKGKNELGTYDGWVDDVTAKMSMDFIKNRDKERPFLVMCHFKSVHDPWATRAPHDTCYQDVFIPEPDNLCDVYENRTEASKRTTLKLERLDQKTYAHKTLPDADVCEQRKYVYQQYVKSYLQGVSVLDENVGKLMAFLKENGLDENTIVVYISDQGHFLGEHGFFSKRLVYDESMQFPLIIRYPRMTTPGSVDKHLVSNIDIAPTLLQMAGLKCPEDIQGESLVPLLEQKENVVWRDGVYYRYWQHLLHRDVAAHYAIRTNEYKLIYFYGQGLDQTDYPPTKPEWELFDLRKDPEEMDNVYNDPEYQDVVVSLKKELFQLKKRYQDDDANYPVMTEINQDLFD